MTTPTDCEARQVSAHDAAALAELGRLVSQYIDTWYPDGSPWSPADAALVDGLPAMVASGATRAFLLTRGGAGAVGCVLLSIDRDRGVGTLGKMYVEPSHRGTGAADALVLAVIWGAAMAGLDSLELIVASDREPARRLYARHGFTPVPGAPQGFVRMRHQLAGPKPGLEEPVLVTPTLGWS